VVKYLLDRGADIEARDENGWTALIAAAGPMGHQDVVECLLEYCPPKWAGVTERAGPGYCQHRM
jgi:ankyrin repeat protein